MDFAFSAEAPIGSECRRILLQQAEGARACLASFANDPDLAIHETRRHNKRMRSIFLLARPVLDSAAIDQANRLVRDAARRFSAARDALVLHGTCDALLARFGRRRVGPSYPALHAALVQRHADILAGGLEEEVAAADRGFSEAAELVARWNWDQVTPEIAFSGVVSNYRLGLRHFEQSRITRDPHECHEWRKRAKYLSFHYQLLAFLDPVAFTIRARACEELASWLGEHHDIAVFEETLEKGEELGLSTSSARTLIRLCEEWRLELEREAFERGSLVYLDRPEAMHERFSDRVAAIAAS